MKLKYFLRGLGVGVVFGTLIMLVAYMTSGGYKLSDEEVIKRAEKLGMVMEESSIPDITEDAEAEDTDKEPAEKPTTSEEAEAEDLSSTDEPVSEDVVQDTTQELTEEITEEATTEEATTKEPATTAEEVPSGDYTTATIEVVSGMSSYEIAQLLENAGIIEDAADFDAYLNANGYSTQLKINTYTFNSDMTYEEIAKALIKEDAE